MIKRIGVEDFNEELEKKDSIIIDIRTIQELKETGVIFGAKHIDFYKFDFTQKLKSLDKKEKYLIYCRSGNRSYSALCIMKDLGFLNVMELEGGIKSWYSFGGKLSTFLNF